MDRDELIDQIVKEGLSITTYGTPGQVEYQIAVNVAKATVARLQPSGDGVVIDLDRADLQRLSVKFAQAADFTTEQDRRIYDHLIALLNPVIPAQK